ncbi:phosphatase PAP2-related protein [Melioribacteraceae bacterium 4301-Me]|uniref:phosphatase PAP2-related protein n=1 Tax=Pyranulibacter aquaticus TaxID=3163344 RepID=UPI00359ACB2C
MNIQQFRKVWQEGLSNSNFRFLFMLSFIVLAFILYWMAKFLAYNETRAGFSFNDPFLSLFPAIKVTWVTFGLIYLALLLALISLSFHPDKLMLALQSYALVILFRMLTIYFLPLNPPATIIPLKDPVVELFGNGKTLLKDLFFSGHTATMFIFFLTAQNKKLKTIFLISTVLVAACVLMQHVHYTIDVIVAPFVTYTSYRIALLIDCKLHK